MSDTVVSKVTGKATEIVVGVLSGVSDITNSVTSRVEDVASSISSGMGEAVHSLSAGMQRLMTSPPSLPDLPNDDGLSSLPAETPHITSHYSPVSLASTESDTSPGNDKESFTEQEEIDHELGLTEDYFSQPHHIDPEMGIELLDDTIEKCKEMILECEESSSRRRALVHRLIQLRLCHERAKEELELAASGIQVRSGHHLQPRVTLIRNTGKEYCDKCANIIWGMFHVAYTCTLCQYQCHARCLKGVQRKCAYLRFKEKPEYELKICPERGLSAQDYMCAECRNLITSRSAWAEPRLCDYSGQYYCPACHWNSRMVIPARVIHNWDFEEQYVSRQAKQLLMYMVTKPVLNVEFLNHHLFRFVEELNVVKKLRLDLLVMKKYLRTCRLAQESKLLRLLEDRQHFVEDVYMYTLQDLIDLNSGILMEYLTMVYDSFSQHIKYQCLTCKGKGFICEICHDNEVIFPFDSAVTVCTACHAAFHQLCFMKNNELCPRCLRLQARKLSTESC